MNKTKKHLFYAVFLIALLCYVLSLALMFFPERSYSTGNAISAVVQLAFGQTRVLKSYATYASLNEKAIQDECLIKRPEAGAACVLMSEGAANDLYLRKCGWWWFQKCVDITADPLFLKHPELHKALQNVLQNPCKFLPDKNELIKEQEKTKGAFPYYSDIGLYISYWRQMGCGRLDVSNIKVIQAYRNQPDDTANIFTLTLGDANAR
ncbi:MAG: hypothetical protein J0M34_05515 [Alphaproteobacteria bacterium]|nr:hypothetical protein [Alphaproteobacteria bacterium]